MGARGLVLTSLGEHVWGHVWSEKHKCGTRSHSEVVAYVDVLMGARGLVLTSLGSMCGDTSHSELVTYVDFLLGARGLVLTSLG